jgi:hypothetical protein
LSQCSRICLVACLLLVARLHSRFPFFAVVWLCRRYFESVQQNLPRGVLFVARLQPSDPTLLPPQKDSRLIGVVALALTEDTRQPVSGVLQEARLWLSQK